MEDLKVKFKLKEGKHPFRMTRGKIYTATESIDPPGWEIIDDDGHREVFFDLSVCFEIV
jgi:hypothetical protein